MHRLPEPLASFTAQFRDGACPVLPEPFRRTIAPLSLFVVGFDSASFSDSQFSHASIACPEPVARSVQKRRAEFFYGRLCARFALHNIGVSSAQVDIGPNREPCWPQQVVGSITHSDVLAAGAVVSSDVCAGLGIDLAERIGRAASEELIGIVVSPREYKYLCTLSACQDVDVCATLVFSAKESFFKAVFNQVQQYFDFDAIEVLDLDFAASTMQFEVQQTLCAGIIAGRRFRIPFVLLGKHVLTVCRWDRVPLVEAAPGQ